MIDFKTDTSKDRYEITFTTDNEEYYHRMQDEARRCIDDSQKKDAVFICRKCNHRLFVNTDGKTAYELVKGFDGYDCPNCGEESHLNWIYERLGNYEKEYGGEKDD